MFDDNALTVMRGRTVFAGLDVSEYDGLTAQAALVDQGDHLRLFTAFWMPDRSLAKCTDEDGPGAEYAVWADGGHLTLVPGRVTDYEAHKECALSVKSAASEYRCGYNMRNAVQLCRELEEAGADMVKVAQSYVRLNDPTKQFLRLVEGRGLRHDGNPVMAFCVEQTRLKRNGRDMIPDPSRGQICGVAATLNALYSMSEGPGEKTFSIKDFEL